MTTLDFKRPHGVIVGHDWARYEQDGVLFDASGKAKTTLRPKKPLPEKIAESGGVAFLKDVLAKGPLSKSIVMKEAETAGLPWGEVMDAAALLTKRVQEKDVEMWRLAA